MAKDFNLADDMMIRIERAQEALSGAREAIDDASDVLSDALHNVRFSQRQEHKAQWSRKVQQRDRLLALGLDCLAALSRYLGERQTAEYLRATPIPSQAAPSQAAPSQAAPSQAAPSKAAPPQAEQSLADVIAESARLAREMEETMKAARRKREGK
jgi:hypothetical protein